MRVGSSKATQYYKQYRKQARAIPLEHKLLAGLVWAICTVHCQVSASETEFTRYWNLGELPKTLPQMRHKAISSARRFCDNVSYQRFARLSVENKLETIVSNVHGLSYAKAAFALASVGDANLGCIDVLIARERGVGRRTWTSAKDYLATLSLLYGKWQGSGDKQWNEYWRLNKAFRRSNHACVFDAIGVKTEGQQRLFYI